MQELPGDQVTTTRGVDVAVENDGIKLVLDADDNDNFVCEEEEDLNFHGWDNEGIECFEVGKTPTNPSAQGLDIETQNGQVVSDSQSKLVRTDQKKRANEKLKQHKNPIKSLKSKDKRPGAKLSETSVTDNKVKLYYCDVCDYSSVRNWNVKAHRYGCYVILCRDF